MAKIKTIKETIKQGIPFKSVQKETMMSLIRTSSQVKHCIDSNLNISNLSSQQYNVLRILRGAAKAIPIMDISDRLVEPTMGITRLINKLNKSGYIDRFQSDTDRRVFNIAINKKGLDLLASLDEKVDRIDEKIFGSMSEAKLKKLTHLLDEARANIPNCC
jgi:MarR family transcriptional regulator, 2-MHQ and catechol-resistance regulon repressor